MPSSWAEFLLQPPYNALEHVVSLVAASLQPPHFPLTSCRTRQTVVGTVHNAVENALATILKLDQLRSELEQHFSQQIRALERRLRENEAESTQTSIEYQKCKDELSDCHQHLEQEQSQSFALKDRVHETEQIVSVKEQLLSDCQKEKNHFEAQYLALMQELQDNELVANRSQEMSRSLLEQKLQLEATLRNRASEAKELLKKYNQQKQDLKKSMEVIRALEEKVAVLQKKDWWFIRSSTTFGVSYGKSHVSFNYIFMDARASGSKTWTQYCANLDLSIFTIAPDPRSAKEYVLYMSIENDHTHNSLCSNLSQWYSLNWKDVVIVSQRCSQYPESVGYDTPLSFIAGRLGASGVMVLREKVWANYAPWVNDSVSNVSVYAVKETTYMALKQVLVSELAGEKGNVTVKFYRPSYGKFDGSFIVMFSIALVCIVFGGFWSGYTKKTIYFVLINKKLGVPSAVVTEQPVASAEDTTKNGRCESSQNNVDHDDDPPAQPFNFCSIIMFVGVIVSMLLLLYYFPSVMIWIVIFIFTVASSFALFACLSFMLGKVPYCTCRLNMSFADVYEWLFRRPFCTPCWKERLEIRMIFLYFGCLAFSVCWFVFRHENYEYYLRDVLGIAFCINLINTIRMPSLKWLTLLLSCVLVYDVFFVFISPLFTKNRCSIMLDVASNGACSANEMQAPGPAGQPDKTHEEIPVVFKVPRMGDPIFRCYDLTYDIEYPPALLGFGDVILPGLLIAFCSGFDQIWKVRFHVYFLVSVIGYAVGMVVCFVALVLMEEGQPALIYLVPFSLIPVHTVGLCKGQWKLLWRGAYPNDETTSGQKHNEQQVPETCNVTDSGSATSTLPSENSANPLPSIATKNSESSRLLRSQTPTTVSPDNAAAAT